MLIYHKECITTSPHRIAHGVNLEGEMHSGVAKALYEKWPKVKEQYLDQYPEATLGQAIPVFIRDQAKSQTIFNIFTQETRGYDGDKYANYGAVIKGVTEALDCILLYGSEDLSIPKIGCGLGGLDWNIVEPILKDLSDMYGITLHIYTKGD